jgi:hypothetical protein
MEPAKVRAMGNAFNGFGKTLTTVAKVLEVQMRILQTTAFIGNVGGAAVASYLSHIQPRIEQLGKQCMELGEDAIKSAADWERAQGIG